MIKVRITPVLRTLGFKEGYTHGHYVHKKGIAEARIYKLNDGTRAVDITYNVYWPNGELKYKTHILQKVPLDASMGKYFAYKHILHELGQIFNRPLLVENADFYFNLVPEKYVEDRPHLQNITS